MIPILSPLDPAPGPARELLRRELSGEDYRPTLVEQAVGYVRDLIDDAMDALADAGPLNLTVLIVIAAVVAVGLLWLLTRLRPETRARTAPPVLGETVRTAAEHRVAARRAAAQDRWDEVVVESLRSIARDLETPGPGGAGVRPGSTAREVVGIAGSVHPDHREALEAVARSFEDVVYGDRRARAEEGRAALETAEAISTAEPRQGATAPMSVAPR